VTLHEALIEGQRYLENKQIPDAGIDAWYLMEYALRNDSGKEITRAWFLVHRDENMEPGQYNEYRKLLNCRGRHVPLQHLTGRQEFMGISFQINDKVLIPRQDTEILVEEAMKVLKPGMKVLDMCTGSGCIIISLMKHIPGIQGMASDISRDALKVAKANADARQVAIDFRQGNLFEATDDTHDVIVSNPPYIPTETIEALMDEVRMFEPIEALDGGKDGLRFYRKLTTGSKDFLKPGGWLIVEIGHDQGAQVSEMMKESGFCQVHIVKDLAGQERVAAGKKHGQ